MVREWEKVALITDGRFSEQQEVFVLTRQKLPSRPNSINENGDEIILDGNKGIIELLVSDKDLKIRKKKIEIKENDFTSGALWKFSESVGSARYGAVTHPGARKEKKNYSDI